LNEATRRRQLRLAKKAKWNPMNIKDFSLIACTMIISSHALAETPSRQELKDRADSKLKAFEDSCK
jgi:hypothetical protein